MKKVLVTGSGGYLGIPLVQHLLSRGHEVVGVDRYFFGKDIIGPEILGNERFILVQKDIRHLTVDDFRGVDVVLDLAGLSNDPTCEIDPKLTHEVNYQGGINVARCARDAGVRQLVYSSSCSVYGQGDDNVLDEESEPRPVSEYARLKLELERRLLELANPDFCVTHLRNATVYGYSNRMRFDLVVNLMTLYAWRERKIFILGGGNQWRPIIHLDDVVRAFELVMEAPKSEVQRQIFNVGSNQENYRVARLATLVKSVIPETELVKVPDDRDQRSYHVRFDKIARQLGFAATRTPLDGAREVKRALDEGWVDPTDPRTVTLDYYRYLIHAETVLREVGIDGKVF